MQMQFDLDLSFGKTSPESCPTSPTPSGACLPGWLDAMLSCCPVEADGQTRVLCLDPKDKLLGASSTPSISGWHKEGGEYGFSRVTLSEVLETGPVPERYFLSQAACAGILRRAERRAKKLPEHLEAALLAASGQPK
jgi:hypothetical protein